MDDVLSMFKKYVLPVLLPSVLALAAYGTYTIYVKTPLDKIRNMHIKDVAELRVELSKVTNNVSTNGVEEQEDKLVTHKGLLTFINTRLVTVSNAVSSCGLPYNISNNICETNRMYDWQGEYPQCWEYLKVINPYSGSETWCMVIGSYAYPDEPKRMINVSIEVGRRLSIAYSKGKMLVYVRKMERQEWSSIPDALFLYNNYKEIIKTSTLQGM